MNARRVTLLRQNGAIEDVVRAALEGAGVLARLRPGDRVALKPNFTYPYYRPGITTSPAVIRAAVRVLKDFTPRIAVVETDGGYGAWLAADAFAGHGMMELRSETGIEVVNLCDEPREQISFQSRWREYQVPLPTRLLHETDLLISMPVPKIHCMTGLTLAYKNQWGCIPDNMRLRRHYVFNDAIVAINKALRPAVLADGTFFLDRTGPMDGDPVPMNLIIAASDAGSFDRYVSELMGYPWQRVLHHQRAVAAGDMPARLDEIVANVPAELARKRTFRLERTARNYIALSGFKSRFLTWFGYESWFGRVVLHEMLYAVAGRPVRPQQASTGVRGGAT